MRGGWSMAKGEEAATRCTSQIREPSSTHSWCEEEGRSSWQVVSLSNQYTKYHAVCFTCSQKLVTSTGYAGQSWQRLSQLHQKQRLLSQLNLRSPLSHNLKVITQAMATMELLQSPWKPRLPLHEAGNFAGISVAAGYKTKRWNCSVAPFFLLLFCISWVPRKRAHGFHYFCCDLWSFLRVLRFYCIIPSNPGPGFWVNLG